MHASETKWASLHKKAASPLEETAFKRITNSVTNYFAQQAAAVQSQQADLSLQAQALRASDATAMSENKIAVLIVVVFKY
jgi:hypothetical protein